MLYVPGWDCHGLPIELKGIFLLTLPFNLCHVSVNRICVTICYSWLFYGSTFCFYFFSFAALALPFQHLEELSLVLPLDDSFIWLSVSGINELSILEIKSRLYGAVLQSMDAESRKELTPIKLRKKAAQFAQKTVNEQRKSFKVC